MFLSGLLPRPMTAEDDGKLLEHGIGFTNIVERTNLDFMYKTIEL